MDTLYTSLAGLIAQQGMLNATANNLSNASSPGYLARTGQVEDAITESVARVGGPTSGQVISTQPSGVIYTNQWNIGSSPIEPSSNPENIAIQGNAFFAVQTPNGVAYTRNGSFSADGLGRLVDPAGDLVLDTNGNPIQLPNTGSFTVEPNGLIEQQGQPVATLGLYQLKPQTMTSQGGGRYGGQATPATGASVLQGSLNTSNVSLIQSAQQLIQSQSNYQALLTVVNEESQRLTSADGLGILT